MPLPFDKRRHCPATDDWWCELGDTCAHACVIQRRDAARASMPDGPRLLKVRPRFYPEHDNVDEFEALVSPATKKRYAVVVDDKIARYEERNTLYLTRMGDVVRFFQSDGKPCAGFGGAKWSVTMIDGTTRDFVGGWSSCELSASLIFPEHRCVPCGLTREREVWEVGYTFSGGALCIEPLVDWWLEHASGGDWGIAALETDHGPQVIPTRGRFVKMHSYRTRIVGRLLPFKDGLNKKYHARHRGTFLRAVEALYAAQPVGAPGQMSGQQNHAIAA